MKRNTLISLSVLLIVMLLAGCKKDSDTTASTNTFNASISSGVWNITSFMQRAENKTSDFSGMDFAFSNNGAVTITGTENASGTWSYTRSVTGSYGSTSSPATFTINMVSGSESSKLSRTWNVGASSATALQLDHPEASEDEHLTFTKK